MKSGAPYGKQFDSRLHADPRVDSTSLNDRLARIAAYRIAGKHPRADDLVAELRVADRLLTVDGVTNVRFDETPDIEVLVGGDAVGIEVRRLRARTADRETQKQLTSATTPIQFGDPARFQAEVCNAVLTKASGLRDKWIPLLFVVSDSPHLIEDNELQFGVREALAQLGASCPFGAALCWWAPYEHMRLATSITRTRLGPGALVILEGLAPASG